MEWKQEAISYLVNYTEAMERNALDGGYSSTSGFPLPSPVFPSSQFWPFNHPKAQVASEGYHYQHSYDQNG
jgi:hypothetical protein